MMMSKYRWRAWLVVTLVTLALMLAASLSAVGAPGVSAAPLNSCNGPVAGQHIYDCANLLTSSEVATLETDAAAVDRAGAPTVVYLQVRDTSAQETLQDAIDLMNRWNVESRTGAHDGFVMFFNLQPGDLRHGQVALYAGEKHKNGNLPQDELVRIREDVMTPLLRNEQTAQGIAAGLQQVAHDLIYGPPPPPQSQVAAAFLGRIPFNVLALLFVGVVTLLYLRLRRQPPTTAGETVHLDPMALASPEVLPPAPAGALIKGRVSDAQMEATILDFARRGLLVIEPAGMNSVRMRLLGDGNDLTGYEQAVWNGLVAESDRDDRMLSSHDLAQVRNGWRWPKTLLRRDLIERGWYDPQAAASRRKPLYIAGAVGLVAVAVAVILMIMAKEGWAAIGLTLFGAASVAAFIWGYTVPDTTVEGEIAAASWRGYRASVLDRAYEPNLETDLPYIVAMGLLGKLGPRLKAASERGYSPSWFRAEGTAEAGGAIGAGGYYPMGVGFYPYWLVFHSSMAPVPTGSGSGSASGGYSGGGAASGGGGSAGNF
ncbi:MAG TPA: TPM domain-containing protein [Ktedonobacterales bacterium]|nr:TPM domain-containing protein [Ktedonobacterales bacterium]